MVKRRWKKYTTNNNNCQLKRYKLEKSFTITILQKIDDENSSILNHIKTCWYQKYVKRKSFLNLDIQTVDKKIISYRKKFSEMIF